MRRDRERAHFVDQYLLHEHPALFAGLPDHQDYLIAVFHRAPSFPHTL
jgi:hypothetical protein